MPNIRWLLALITHVHRFVYRSTGGRVGGNLVGLKMLMITNVGRKSGREFQTPLLYIDDPLGWVVVASNAGDDRDPAWWLNLKARPETRIQVGREQHAVRARRATAEEAEKLWPRLDASYRDYARYRAGTSREIPVVLLEPLTAAS